MATDRYIDLLRQGFMRRLPERSASKPKTNAPIVACDACRDWHRKGKHVVSAELRKENIAKSRAERKATS